MYNDVYPSLWSLTQSFPCAPEVFCAPPTYTSLPTPCCGQPMIFLVSIVLSFFQDVMY